MLIIFSKHYISDLVIRIIHDRFADDDANCHQRIPRFLFLVLEVLGLSFLYTHHPNALDNIVHTAAKGQLNLRKTLRCFGRRTY